MEINALKRQPLQKVLRDLGFKREFAYNDVVSYRLILIDRYVTVQLWSDGRHRASHMYYGEGNAGKGIGSSRVCPTDFTTVEGMRVAIRYESTRNPRKL